MFLFQSERLRFRVWSQEDLDQGMTLWGNEIVGKFVGGALSNDQVAQSIENGIKHHQQHGVQIFYCETHGGQFIGACGFAKGDHEGEAELIIHLHPDHHGKGYGKEACLAAFQWLKDQPQLGFDKVVASAALENHGSLGLMRSLGMKSQGIEWFEDLKQEEEVFTYTL